MGKRDGYTPLLHASTFGHKDIAEMLIAKGADLNAVDKDGCTPLDRALQEGHTSIAELLFAHGTEVIEVIDNKETFNDLDIMALFPVERAMIEKQTGFRKLEEFIRGQAKLMKEKGEYFPFTLTISGYDLDSRQLFEIAEVCDWSRKCIEKLPGLFYFLDKTSKKAFTGWPCGPMSPKKITSDKFQKRYWTEFDSRFKQGFLEGEEYLRECGVSESMINSFRIVYAKDKE